jgi:hypothetical protein
MAKNFIEAKTEIDDLIFKKKELLTKIANSAASAIVDRVNGGKTNSLTKDIDNLLEGLSDAEKYEVMKSACIAIAKHRGFNGKSSNNSSTSDSRSPLFGRFS